MAKRRTDTLHIGEEIKKILDEQSSAVMGAKERALDKAAEFMQQKLEEATPVETGETRKSWITKDQYASVRYIKNTRVNKKGIPVVNLLEYSVKGKPFFRRTFLANKEKVVEIIKKELQNGSNR